MQLNLGQFYFPIAEIDSLNFRRPCTLQKLTLVTTPYCCTRNMLYFHKLNPLDLAKYLGVKIDEHLAWKEHINLYLNDSEYALIKIIKSIK